MDKYIHLFGFLWKAYDQNEQWEKVFEELKMYLTSPPLPSQMTPGEALYMYLLVSPMPSLLCLYEKRGVQHKD